jgi:opacity protein-like surface antigen
MGSFKNYALAGILALAASTTAHAADLPAPPPPVPYVPVEVSGGWYLRGDIGMTNQEVDRLSFVSVNGQAVPANLNDANFRTDFVEFDSSVFGGIGLGYQFNPWLRVDVTGEYRGGASFHGFERSVALPTDIDKYTAIKSEWVGLVNAYFDLGTWYGLTPFVGAGVGFTRTKISSFVDTFVGAGGGIGGALAENNTETELAWALHAGVAYDVTPNFKVEVAYRYLNLGDGQTGVLTSFDSGTTGRVAVKFKDLDSHDFKVGLRWMLGGPVLAAAAPPAPVMRRF